jgi:hypothetical protein
MFQRYIITAAILFCLLLGVTDAVDLEKSLPPVPPP